MIVSGKDFCTQVFWWLHLRDASKIRSIFILFKKILPTNKIANMSRVLMRVLYPPPPQLSSVSPPANRFPTCDWPIRNSPASDWLKNRFVGGGIQKKVVGEWKVVGGGIELYISLAFLFGTFNLRLVASIKLRFHMKNGGIFLKNSNEILWVYVGWYTLSRWSLKISLLNLRVCLTFISNWNVKNVFQL